MTGREIQITRAILQALHNSEGGQLDELLLHKALSDPLGMNFQCSAAELRAVMAMIDAQGWLIGVPARFTGRMKWSINDAGEAALLQLSQS